jgi:hypothetical protein
VTPVDGSLDVPRLAGAKKPACLVDISTEYTFMEYPMEWASYIFLQLSLVIDNTIWYRPFFLFWSFRTLGEASIYSEKSTRQTIQLLVP